MSIFMSSCNVDVNGRLILRVNWAMPEHSSLTWHRAYVKLIALSKSFQERRIPRGQSVWATGRVCGLRVAPSLPWTVFFFFFFGAEMGWRGVTQGLRLMRPPSLSCPVGQTILLVTVVARNERLLRVLLKPDLSGRQSANLVHCVDLVSRSLDSLVPAVLK